MYFYVVYILKKLVAYKHVFFFARIGLVVCVVFNEKDVV